MADWQTKLLLDHAFLRIKKAVNRAFMFAREQLQRNAGGDYRPVPNAALLPAPLNDKESAALSAGPNGSPPPLEIFDLLYAKETQVKPATIKLGRPIVAKVQTKHPALSGITTEGAIAWKGRLVDAGLNNNTIRNSYLAAMRTMCRWAVANGRIAANPFATVTIKATGKGKTRPKGLVDAEAATILRATLDPVPEGFSADHAAARRWVPWLHKAGKGPLLYDPGRRRGGPDMNPQYKKIGESVRKWVRELGVDNPSIMPNDAWRQHFKTIARKVKMDVGARDYMQGHVPATEGEAYGDFPPDVLLHEISKLLRYEVGAGA